MKRGIPMSHVQVLKDGGSVIPQINLTPCSPACLFYADCSNFRNRETCQGFRLSQNGDSENRILSILRSGHKTYIENAINKLPKFNPENQEVIIRDVQHYLHPDDEDFPTETLNTLDRRVRAIEEKIKREKTSSKTVNPKQAAYIRSLNPNRDINSQIVETKVASIPIAETEKFSQIYESMHPNLLWRK